MRTIQPLIAKLANNNSNLLLTGERGTAKEPAAKEKQLRRLVVEQMKARDDEVKRIAAVLHDESSQLLAAVYLAVDELAKDLAPAEIEKCERIKGLLDQIEDRLRNLSHDLHPAMLDDLGLLPSLNFLTQQVSQRAGIQVKLKEAMHGRLSPRLELVLYRVVQEALTNARRHSQAKKVDVRLCDDAGLVQCSVQDDGIGFDPKASLCRSKNNRQGLGLVIARERIEAMGGIFQVHTAPGEGTKLSILIPKEQEDG